MSHPPLTFFISGEHMRWMDRGRCNGTPDWELFFADERAKRRGLPAEVPPEVAPVCGSCDVRLECLDWALRNDEVGVWGGTTLQQREAMKRPIVRAKCPACQSTNLFRAGSQQVCGDCGASWEATKIHGHAHAPVEQPATAVPVPLHPGNVIRLPVKWVYTQPELFDAASFRVEVARVRCSRKRRKPTAGDQPPIPGLAEVVALVARQARTRPVAPAVAA